MKAPGPMSLLGRLSGIDSSVLDRQVNETREFHICRERETEEIPGFLQSGYPRGTVLEEWFDPNKKDDGTMG